MSLGLLFDGDWLWLFGHPSSLHDPNRNESTGRRVGEGGRVACCAFHTNVISQSWWVVNTEECKYEAAALIGTWSIGAGGWKQPLAGVSRSFKPAGVRVVSGQRLSINFLTN